MCLCVMVKCFFSYTSKCWSHCSDAMRLIFSRQIILLWKFFVLPSIASTFRLISYLFFNPACKSCHAICALLVSPIHLNICYIWKFSCGERVLSRVLEFSCAALATRMPFRFLSYFAARNSQGNCNCLLLGASWDLFISIQNGTRKKLDHVLIDISHFIAKPIQVVISIIMLS